MNFNHNFGGFMNNDDQNADRGIFNMNINDLMKMDMFQFQNQGGNVSYSVSSYSTTKTTSNGGHTEYSTQAFSNKVQYDGSGNQPHREFFQNKVAGVVDNGHKLEECQSTYQNNSTGQYKAAHQRVLDDKGVRMIKEKNFKTGDEVSDSVFKGIDEDDAMNFHHQFDMLRNNYHNNHRLGGNNDNKQYLPQNSNDDF